ncbi:MAG: lipoprotein-releasing system ATP-binding protein LolD [Firmicutes bacterium HGW-Firmicutes-12]|jgi:lipoprotein-releasing system ATP-binding protein|nr:MAG: lipoprotein-releasing system ATP-binding protein LolD [Firmicutes bacterium HGW-Firmicutes-12]
MDKYMVQLHNIIKFYGDSVKNQVLFDVTLDILPGTFVSLIGPSGSGKSTLLNILGTLDQSSGGDLIIDGLSMISLSENELADFRNRAMGFIFQFHYLFPDFTAMENVLLPYRISHSGFPDQRILERAKYLLTKVGLENKLDARINNLSGGQQQRVAIARALINQPKLILADEPTGNLDTKSSDQIIQLLREINKEQGSTFIVVTHDRSIAARSDRIIELVDGRINNDFSPQELGQAKTWEGLGSYSCRD